MPIILILTLVLAVAIGFAARGSLRPFEHVVVHLWGLAVAGLLLTIVPLPQGVSSFWIRVAYAVGYTLLIAFVWVNRRLPAAPLILAGLVLNMAVIVANAGMPVRAEAVRAAGGDVGGVAAVDRFGRHHVMTDDDILRPLGDVMGVPPPLADVLSIGDVVLYVGLACFVVLVMLGRPGENRRPPARWFRMYRGMHQAPTRRPGTRILARPRPALPAAAARSGTRP